MMPYWLALAGAITTSLIAQGLLKAGVGDRSFVGQLFDWHTILGLALYGGAAILYIVALRRIPMSIALPCTAISYVAGAAVGHFLFGEAFGALHAAGLAFIILGVCLLAAAA